MSNYVQTLATITNPDGESVTVDGPTVQDWVTLDNEWKRAYRFLALEGAASQGLALPGRGVKVVWSIVEIGA